MFEAIAVLLLILCIAGFIPATALGGYIVAWLMLAIMVMFFRAARRVN